MSEEARKQQGADKEPEERYTAKGPWGHIIRGMWRSPLGLVGVMLTTVSATLLLVGILVDQFGFFNNPYAGIFTYLLLPGGMITGLALIPVVLQLLANDLQGLLHQGTDR